MTNFFEKDSDEIVFRNRVFTDYFNLYPNLAFEAVLAHLQGLDWVVVVDTEEDSEGWQIHARFRVTHFLVSTHYHGTSTLFCVERGCRDEMQMLAFLGCFLPVLRDKWR
jgi:hypothetical protein